MFDTLLIANRGEIACRIMRTARRLHIETVAVYSDADVNALHVELADRAFRIGPAPALESYLCQEAILDVARRSGAQAIHPGYGFLAENSEFAERCRADGVVFVGPSPDAIRAMGVKSQAKRLMEDAGVPVVPGFHGEQQDDEALLDAARELGFPLLIKASAGGGGKGMRVVQTEHEFVQALAGARREAAAAFADDRMLLERLIEQPRHVEVQVFGDTYGLIVHLFDRDCSIQRRHQKIIEEAPAPGLAEDLRASMALAAVTAAQAIDYVGAGTVEFIVSDDAFYFMEMNTRLQVEHPVTEMITGQDLVAWQLRIAAGEPLPCQQHELAIRGHAIEARVYAEDSVRDFLPVAGTLTELEFPSENIRVESAVRSGDTVGVFYDPMIAKLIAKGHDRGDAVRALSRALKKTHIGGPKTNLDILRRVVDHPAFANAALTTGFIDDYRGELISNQDLHPPLIALALAAIYEIVYQTKYTGEGLTSNVDPNSPWNVYSGWRLNAPPQYTFGFAYGDRRYGLTIHSHTDGYSVLGADNEALHFSAQLDAADHLIAVIDAERVCVTVTYDDNHVSVTHNNRRWVFGRRPKDYDTSHAVSGQLAAPMPGRIIRLLVGPGDQVQAGDSLVVMEAMKMEHTITAPTAGVITTIGYRVGDMVTEGAELLVLDSPESAPIRD